MSILTTDTQSPNRLIAPFRGGPLTRTFTGRNGEPEIAVQARALTPLRARLTHYAGIGAGVAMSGICACDLALGGPVSLEGFAGLLGLTAAAYPVARFGLRQLVMTGARVTFAPDRITVSHTLKSRRFERSHPHGFVLLPHDKADKERDRHAFLDRKYPPKWWSWKRKKYYGESFHVVLECFGERHDILTVFGGKKAAAIQARLKACDAVMDGIGFSDSGVALSPGSDWNVDAGGL